MACSSSNQMTLNTGVFNPCKRGENPHFPECQSNKFSFARLSESNDADISELWRHMMSQYSERRLTYPNDKLPALAGLANAWRLAKPDKYVKGM